MVAILYDIHGNLPALEAVLADARAAGADRFNFEQVPGVSLHTAEQEAPGLAGVTVTTQDGTSLSLQRGQGGLDAVERARDGDEHHWKILGASRGEGGILGEGIRQALLRDPTYLPALEAARGLCPA